MMGGGYEQENASISLVPFVFLDESRNLGL